MDRIVISLACLMMAGSALADTASTPGKPALQLDPVVVYGTVDATGAIRDLSCGPKVAENICKAMTSTVATWQFKPGTRAGQPAAMDVNLNLGVVAVPLEKGYSLQVTNHVLSAKEGRLKSPVDGKPQYKPPVYPVDDLRRGTGGIVDVEILLQPPSDKPVLGRLWFNGAESDRRQSLVKAATDAVMQWELPALPPEQLTLCVPIEFTSGTRSNQSPERKSPCTSRYAEGFALPVLLTKVGIAR